MTTFTIITEPPYTVGQRITVSTFRAYEFGWGGIASQGTILRVEPHELLVRVGGKPMAFQRHDGKGKGWTWRG